MLTNLTTKKLTKNITLICLLTLTIINFTHTKENNKNNENNQRNESKSISTNNYKRLLTLPNPLCRPCPNDEKFTPTDPCCKCNCTNFCKFGFKPNTCECADECPVSIQCPNGDIPTPDCGCTCCEKDDKNNAETC